MYYYKNIPWLSLDNLVHVHTFTQPTVLSNIVYIYDSFNVAVFAIKFLNFIYWKSNKIL